MRVAGVVPVLTAAAVLEQNIGQERTAFPRYRMFHRARHRRPRPSANKRAIR